jgi:hypothetical protein
MTDPSTAFGFSFESEDEITALSKKITEQAQTQIQEISAVVNTKTAQVQDLTAKHINCQQKLNLIVELITPFLDNLAAEPEKIYIRWPERSEKIKAFKLKLKEVLEG